MNDMNAKTISLYSDRRFSIHKKKGKFLVIAPESATWVTCDENQMVLLEQFTDGMAPKDILKKALFRAGSDDAKIDQLLDTWSILWRFYNSVFDENRIRAVNNLPKNVLHINVTEKCNLSCRHCYINAGTKSSGEISTSAIIRMIEKYSKICQGSPIVFTGGEPLLHNGLGKILMASKELGIQNSLFTNGILLSKRKLDEIQNSVDQIQISLDGASKFFHDSVRGEGTFVSAVKAIRLVQERGIKLQIAITINPDNAVDLLQNYANLSDIFQNSNTKIRVGVVYPEGRALDTWPKINPRQLDDYADKLISKLCAVGNIKRSWDTMQGQKNCIGGGMVVYADGNVYPCRSEKYFLLGNIFYDDFEKIKQKSDSFYHRYGVEEITMCQACELKYLCSGGCRIANLHRNGNPLIPSCDDEKKKQFHDTLMQRAHSFHYDSNSVENMQGPQSN